MSDRIILDRIAVFGRHGLFPSEAREGQTFLISLDCRLDLGPAGRSDDLTQGVSYADLAARVVAIGSGRRFRLIEALAEAIAADILARVPAISCVTVRVDKPGAPIPVAFASVAVEITRRRDG